MKNNVGKTVVPVAAIRPLIEEWEKRQISHEPASTGFGRKGVEYQWDTPLCRLARESGVPRRRIYGIMTGKLVGGKQRPDGTAYYGQENISFDTADKLLCAMDMTSAWHVELRDYYQDEIETATYERHLVDTPEMAA